MMNFFYSPAAAARSRRGRDKDHHHGRASSTSTSGRRTRESTKPNETRSPTPKSPQSTTSHPNIGSDHSRSQLTAQNDLEQPTPVGVAQGRPDIGSESARADEQGHSKDDRKGPDTHASSQLPYQVRTPASLQPYLEDDISEGEEETPTAIASNDRTVVQPEVAPSHPRETTAAPILEPVQDSLLKSHGDESLTHSVASTILEGGTEDHAGKAVAPPELSKPIHATKDDNESRVYQSVSQRQDLSRPQSKRTDESGIRSEMQERRRSRLSQSFVAPDGTTYAEPSSNFGRAFTPPVGPLGAAPSSSSPLFMSPVPMRAPYPAYEPYASRGVPSTYPPGYYPSHPMGHPPPRSMGHISQIPHYMDQLIQNNGAVPYYQPLELTSSVHTGDDNTLGPEELEGARPAYDPALALLARVENALPDLHQFVQQYKETSNHMDMQLETFRRADAHKTDLLREKDHYIHRLAGELEHYGHQHMHERKSLEMQLIRLEEECRRLKDNALLTLNPRQAFAEERQVSQFRVSMAEQGTPRDTAVAQEEKRGPPEHEDMTIRTQAEGGSTAGTEDADNPALLSQSQERTRASSSANKELETKESPNKNIPGGPEAQATVPVEKGQLIEGKSHISGEAGQISHTSDKAPTQKRWKEVMPGAFDIGEGEKIEVQEGSDEDAYSGHSSSKEMLLLENLKLRSDLEKVRASWESDKVRLLETNRRLECAAAKLGIENVSYWNILHCH